MGHVFAGFSERLGLRLVFCFVFSRLQAAYIQAKNEIKHLQSEKQTLQDQMSWQTAAFEKSLLAKTKEVEEIRQQVSQAQRRRDWERFHLFFWSDNIPEKAA